MNMQKRCPVNPLPRIFAGCNGVLVLYGDGRLYGMGNNDTGSLGKERMGQIVRQPQLIAENIRRAAAGYCYSICLTMDGQIMLIGKSGIPYQSRLKQFSNVEDVFAAPDRDVFWILLKDGSLYIWGDNEAGFITPSVSQAIHRFENVEVDVEYQNSITKRYAVRTDGPQYYIHNEHSDSDKKAVLENAEIKLKKSDFYQECVRLHGDDNLRIEFSLINDKLCSSRSENEKEYENGIYDNGIVTKRTWEVHRETYQAKIILSNQYIYQPVRVTDSQKYLPGVCYYGSGLISCNRKVDEKLVKIVRFKIKNIWHEAVLRKDGILELWDDKGTIRTISDVEDVAVNSNIYILEKSGKLLEAEAGDVVRREMPILKFMDKGIK